MEQNKKEEFPEDLKRRERLSEPEGLPKGEDCPHYPCHFKGQVCVFCYCPKYPCEDSRLGKWIVSSRGDVVWTCIDLSLIHISEPTRLLSISYAVFCLAHETTEHLVCRLLLDPCNDRGTRMTSYTGTKR